MDKHFEVWKVIFNGEGTEGENYGRKRHWKIVDKIETSDGETAYKDVVNNLSEFGYAIVTSEYPIITAKLGKAKLETYVVSPAGKEYGWADWDETIAPKIAIRRIAHAERNYRNRSQDDEPISLKRHVRTTQLRKEH